MYGELTSHLIYRKFTIWGNTVIQQFKAISIYRQLTTTILSFITLVGLMASQCRMFKRKVIR